MTKIGRSVIFYKYLLSYIFICTFPVVIMGIILYENTVGSLKSEIEKSNLTKLSQVESMMERQMKEFGNIAFLIAEDSKFLSYNLNDGGYGRIEAVDELKKYKANSSIIDTLFLYLRHDDLIYSSDGFYSYDSFRKYFYRGSGWNDDQFYEDINRIANPQIKRMSGTDQASPAQRYLVYMYPVQPQSPRPYGTVVFAIQESELSSMMSNILGDFEGESYILDENDQILASVHQGEENGKLKSQMIAMIKEHDKSGIYELSSEHTKYSFSYVKSDTIGWSFVTILPTSQFMSRVIQKRTFTIELISLIAMMGVGIAFAFTHYHYVPIRRLANRLNREAASQAPSVVRNEFRLIESAADVFVSSNRELLREQLLAKLLAGKIGGAAQLQEWMKRSHTEFAGAGFYVLLIDGKTRFVDKAHIAQLLRENGSPAYCTDDPNGNGAAVIAMLDGSPDVAEAKPDLASLLAEWLEEAHGQAVHIGIGGVYSEPLQLNRSYIEASAALEYKMIAGGKAITNFRDIAASHHEEPWYPVEEQIVYLQSLKKGDRAVAVHNLRSILDSIASKGASLLMLRYICFDMVNSAVKVVREIHAEHFREEIESLMGFDSLDELYARLERLTEKVCLYVEERKESKNVKLRDSVLDYVHRHFRDGGISLERIADEHDVSVSFLSRFFKEQVGETFTDYLSELRMKEAKLRLLHSEQSVGQIVEEIGYMNASNFVRKFKKTEGVTPGQYRKLYAPGIGSDQEESLE